MFCEGLVHPLRAGAVRCSVGFVEDWDEEEVGVCGPDGRGDAEGGEGCRGEGGEEEGALGFECCEFLVCEGEGRCREGGKGEVGGWEGDVVRCFCVCEDVN